MCPLPPVNVSLPPVYTSYQCVRPVSCWYISLSVNVFVGWWKAIYLAVIIGIVIASIVGIVFCMFLKKSVLLVSTFFLSCQCVLLSAVLLMCPSLRFVPPLIDRFIDRWILMSGIWNRHHMSPSPSIIVHWLTLLSPINTHPSKRVSIYQIICSEINQKSTDDNFGWDKSVVNQPIPLLLFSGMSKVSYVACKEVVV